MPKQKRWALKRDLDNAVNNMKSAQDKLIKVGQQFKGVHEEYYEALLAVFAAIELVIEATEKIRNDI